MIVMDLEWNHGTVDKQLLLEGRTLRFEIIQIGAVQVDSLGNICKTFEASRYKALGNAIALPCAEYIMAGIAEVLR